MLASVILLLLIADEDHRPGDRQRGQRCYGYRDTPDTGLAYCRFNTHDLLLLMLSPLYGISIL